ncbi:hypothetical protein NA57DRAFT_77268 [Rhizodiscina lignyota]|uniref:Uncharacterized protein n=1 Tax=Rhizodiscina lignyota TaxID=1504668 RepID=A0A9P4M761_9PEZI|nr:hypothetical protein NA57DRAFT_77268 [Rhizodiscina lignyota]
MPTRKRQSSSAEVDDKPVKKARSATSKPKAKAKKDLGTCSLTKKEIGDRVKEALTLQKYHIPRMRLDMKMDVAFFRSFFVNNDALSKPLQIAPSDFDDTSSVVVVEMGHNQAGELLGVSKVKGGNRMETTYLAAMCVVFRPSEGRCTMWLTV